MTVRPGSVVKWIEHDTSRRGDRPDFNRTLAALERLLDQGERPALISAELPFLFRRASDRRRLERLLERGLDILGGEVQTHTLLLRPREAWRRRAKRSYNDERLELWEEAPKRRKRR